MFKWHEHQNTHMLYRESTGMIMGLAHKVGVDGPWYIGKVWINRDRDEFYSIGNFIDLSKAKKAVEDYWFKEDNTLQISQ